MPDGNNITAKPTVGGTDSGAVSLDGVDSPGVVEGSGPGEPAKARPAFLNVVRDGWKHLGGGRWENIETGERERRAGKSGTGRGPGRPRTTPLGGTEARERAPQGKGATLALGSVERILLSIHFGLSIALKAPELELRQDEAEQYAKAVAAVGRHYDVGAKAKTLDWINLATTMGSIYGVRAMAIAVRRRRPGADRAAPAPTAADQAAPQEAGAVIDFSLMTGGPRPQ